MGSIVTGVPSPQRTIDEVCDDYVERSAALDPVWATSSGVPGYDRGLTDYSPGGERARDDLDRTFLAELTVVEQVSDRDRRSRRVLHEHLTNRIEKRAAGEHLRDLSTLDSPLAQVREVFDLMPTDTEDDWEALATRLEAVPWSLGTARDALAAGLAADLPGSRRLALAVAEQSVSWAGAGDQAGYFETLVRGAEVPDSLTDRLFAAARAARRACLDHAVFLREEYVPHATTRVGVGAERYALHARLWTGEDLDLDDTYAWGWAELADIVRRMRELSQQILPGASLPETIAHVKSHPDYVLAGEDALRSWLQDLLDTTVDALDGVHFDIPAQIRRVEAMIAPPGGAAAMYYTPPTEDFSRPGRTWYPTQGRTTFPLWMEKSICYHEGVPGHHLEVGGAKTRADSTTRLQRVTYIAGYSEGWALYAERLMGELGFLDDPVYELGMLAASALRAARVVIDIGLHLGLRVPADPGFDADWLVPGADMTPDAALEIGVNAAPFPREFMASEIDRYLGLPGQAVSYKVGERVWLEVREAARSRLGRDFDLKEFHSGALALGSLGLAQLREEMLRE
jgi:uncharacterized protein (DUF885 family)